METSTRPCERYCEGCQKPLHHSRFRTFLVRHSTVSNSVGFKKLCRACEQIERNKRKNTDRPKAIIYQRAKQRASKLGVSLEFMMTNMNWRALVPVMRAMGTDEAVCLNCGHAFLNERDIQIEHHEPPRGDGDWAREHARNLGLACSSCNKTKSDKPRSVYLDDQESARLSNERNADAAPFYLPGDFPGEIQVDLFEWRR